MLEKIKQAFGALEAGGLQRQLDDTARAMGGVSQGAVTLVNQAGEIEAKWVPTLGNFRRHTEDLGTSFTTPINAVGSLIQTVDGITPAAERVGQAAKRVTSFLGEVADEARRARGEVEALNTSLSKSKQSGRVVVVTPPTAEPVFEGI
jgi:hypothetical protein